MASIKELKFKKNINEKLEKSGYKTIDRVINANIKKFRKKTGFTDGKIVDILSHARRFHVKKHFENTKKKYSLFAKKPKENRTTKKFEETKGVTKSYNLIFDIVFIIGLIFVISGVNITNYDYIIGGLTLIVLSLVIRF